MNASIEAKRSSFSISQLVILIEKQPWLEIGLIVLLAFAMRLVVSAVVLGFDYFPDPDRNVYETYAISMLQGRGFVADEGRSYIVPFYPMFLAAVYWLFGLQNFVAVKIIEALIGSFTCAWVYLIGKNLFGTATGRIAGWISVLYPFLVFAVCPELTENLFTFLLAAALVCLSMLTRQFRWVAALGGGLLLGLATLTRPVTILVPVVLIVWALLAFRQIPQLWKSALVVSGVMLLVVSPWLVRNYLTQHQWVIATEDGVTLWGSNNPVVVENPEKAGRWVFYKNLPHADELVGLSELELRQKTNELGGQFIRENLDKMPSLLVQKQLRFWSLYPNRSGFEKLASMLSYGLLFPFILFGAVWAFLKRRPQALLLLGIMTPFVAGVFVYYGSTRMRLPIEPYLIIFAAAALNLLVERIGLKAYLQRLLNGHPAPGRA